MRTIYFLALVLIVAAVAMVGCQKDPVSPVTTNTRALQSQLTGAMIQSATLHVYVNTASGQSVEAHRITADWGELTVTWLNFGGAFAPGVEGTFTGSLGWQSVDITALMKAWVDGVYPNYGVLLNQINASFPRTKMNSREAAAFHPYVEVTLVGGGSQTLVDLADAWIYSIESTFNGGADDTLFTGWDSETSFEKQTLIRFDMPVEPELAAIGDFVWLDLNKNGVQDVDEPGLPGVTVNLYACGGGLLFTTTTNASGHYLFSNLTPGSYFVEFVAPNGFVFSPMDQGSDDGKDSDANTTTGRTICAALVGGQTDLTWDAGLYPSVVTEPAALGDFVWNDLNMDGIQDLGELGIPGVRVNLYACGGGLLFTTTTDATGHYLFSNLSPGSYFVEFVAPNGLVFSPMDQGIDDGKDSDANTTTGRTICVTLVAGQTDLTWDAGLFTPPDRGCTLTIGFWKNHAGFGPQADVVTPLLPIWLGNAGGGKSVHVTTAQMAVDYLSQNVYGTASNGITKLYAQLLGAKLNLASGADGSAIATTIDDADAFLATHDYLDWSSLTKSQKNLVLAWHSALGNYNEGLIGPGHCDD